MKVPATSAVAESASMGRPRRAKTFAVRRTPGLGDRLLGRDDACSRRRCANLGVMTSRDPLAVLGHLALCVEQVRAVGVHAAA